MKDNKLHSIELNHHEDMLLTFLRERNREGQSLAHVCTAFSNTFRETATGQITEGRDSSAFAAGDTAVSDAWMDSRLFLLNRLGLLFIVSSVPAESHDVSKLTDWNGQYIIREQTEESATDKALEVAGVA